MRGLMLAETDPDLPPDGANSKLRGSSPQLAGDRAGTPDSTAAEGSERREKVILEIRKGAGGDEASLFAAEVFRMYTRYAEEHGWKVEVTSLSESSVGGLSEVIALVSGKRCIAA